MKSNFLKTILANWRDLLVFVLFGLGLAILGGVVDYAASATAESTFARLTLPTLANYLKGFSNFTGASICATLVWMWLWPTVSHWSNDRFAAGWDALSDAQRFFTYVALIAVALIAAAICFSA
jgi:hypothetical protein